MKSLFGHHLIDFNAFGKNVLTHQITATSLLATCSL